MTPLDYLMKYCIIRFVCFLFRELVHWGTYLQWNVICATCEHCNYSSFCLVSFRRGLGRFTPALEYGQGNDLTPILLGISLSLNQYENGRLLVSDFIYYRAIILGFARRKRRQKK